MKYSGPIPGAPNFTYEELIRSETAEKYNIDNTPKFDQIWVNLTELAENVLQPARDHFGEPIVVTSGFRCGALNRAVHGSPTSFHVQGCAADIRFRRGSRRKDSDLFGWIYKNCNFVELIAEGVPNGWVHAAYCRGRNDERQLKYMLDEDGRVLRGSYQHIVALYKRFHA